MFRRGAVEAELDEELRYHIEELTAQYAARGMTPEVARREAVKRMGGIERRKDESRDTRRVSVVENLARDVRHSLRSLRHNPAYAAVAIITLALGIGANTAIFSVVHSVLLKPLDYPQSDRLVTVGHGTVAGGVFLDWKEATRSYSAMGVEEYWTPNRTGGDKPEQLTGVRASWEMLTLLGTHPLLGRVFDTTDAAAGRTHLLVVGYPFWTTRLGSDPAAVGKTLVLDGEPYTIIGVMPPGFQFTPYWNTKAAFGAPLDIMARRNDRAGESLRAFARLAPGVSIERAQAEMQAIAPRLEKLYPGTNQNVLVTPLRDEVVGNVRPALLILLAAVAVVLIIACANVAHLQLIRASARTREFGLRLALGASRARIIQQSLVESALLSIAGGLVGLLLASEGVRFLVKLAPPSLPRVGEIGLDGMVFGFALTATVVAGVVFGLLPALRVARVNSPETLKEGSRGAGESRRQRRVRGLLVVSEFALALVLLVGAGLLLRSFSELLRVDPGFDVEHVASMQVSVKGTPAESVPSRAQFFRDMIARVSAMPGVEAAGAISHVPLNGDDWNFPYAIQRRPIPEAGKSPRAKFLVVEPGYFRAMGIALRGGRDFSADDIASAAHDVVISEAMAKKNWPNESAIGQRITVDDPAKSPDWFTVIGVVADVRQTQWAQADQAAMYFPYVFSAAGTEKAMMLPWFLHPDYMTLVVRAKGDPASLARPIEGVVREMEKDAPVSASLTMKAAVEEQFATPRFYMMLIGIFAVVAVVLAGVGVYGVVSYSVARRSHEIGVRVALGADRATVFGMVIGQGFRLAAIGGVIGLIAAFGATRYLGSLLYGVGPTDLITFVGVVVVLGCIAVIACVVPARAALRVPAVDALRSE